MAKKKTEPQAAAPESEEPANSAAEETSGSAPEETAGGEPSGSTIVSRGIKIVGETFVVPGSSLILDGNILAGGAHVAGGLLARAFLGPVGWFAIAANSYTKSVTGKHVTEHLKSAFNKTDDQ